MPPVPALPPQWRGQLRDRWPVVLAVLAVAVVATGVARVVVGPQPPPVKDSLVFEYIGWYLAHGGRLYLDAWEIKPPLNYQTTAALALVAGDNPLAYHYLAVATTASAAVGTSLLAGRLVVDVTDDRVAGVVGGLAVFAHPVFFMRAAYGFKSKYFVLFAGLGAVALALRDRYRLAGVAAAAATAYWQLGVVFPLVVLGMAGQREGRSGAVDVAVGGAALTALTVAPVVLRGGLVAMLAEVVVAPLYLGSTMPLGRRLGWLFDLLGAGGVAVGLAGVGLAGMVATDHRRDHWWLPVAWAWFAGHLAFVNVDYYADLIPLVGVSAVAVGVLLGTASRRLSRPLSAAVAGLVLLNVATLGGVAGMDPHPTKPRLPVKDPGEVEAPYFIQERRALLFHGMEPTTCHIFISTRQREWIRTTGGRGDAVVCGRLPPGERWIRSAVPPFLRGPPPDAGQSASGPDAGDGTGTTPTPDGAGATPTPDGSDVVADALRLAEADDGNLSVAVAVVNEGERARDARVVVTARAGEREVRRATAIELAPGERRTLRFGFDVDPDAPDLAVDVSIRTGGNATLTAATAPAGAWATSSRSGPGTRRPASASSRSPAPA